MSSLLRTVTNCTRLCRTDILSGIAQQRSVVRYTANEMWHVLAKRIDDVRAMRRNAFIDKAPVRRFDDDYGRIHIGEPHYNRQSVHSSMSRMPKIEHIEVSVADDDNAVDVLDANARYNKYMLEKAQRKYALNDDDDADDSKFDPRYNDCHYRSYRKERARAQKQTHKLVPKASQKRIWNNYGHERVQPYLQMASEEQLDEHERQRRQKQRNDLRRSWERRSEPVRIIRKPVMKYTNEPMAAKQKQSTVKPADKYDYMRYKQEESKYWHCWDNCPDERNMFERYETDAAAELDEMPHEHDEYTSADHASKIQTPHVYENNRRGHSKFIKPPTYADEYRRRYQTSSKSNQQAWTLPTAEYRHMPTFKPKTIKVTPPRCGLHMKSKSKRKLNGLEKQFQKYWGYTANEYTEANELHNTAQHREDNFINETSDAHDYNLETVQCSNKAAVSSEGKPAIVEPRKYQIFAEDAQRREAPVPSYSEYFAAFKSDDVPHSEYTGYGKPTVCDIWAKFQSEQMKRAN